MSRRFSTAEFRALHAQGLTDAKIAKRFGVATSTIQRLRVKLGLPANGIIDVDALKRLHSSHYTDKEISGFLKVTPYGVARRRKELGIKPNPAHGRAVRELHAEGFPNWTIAQRLGLTTKTVENVLRRLGLQSNVKMQAQKRQAQYKEKQCADCGELKHIRAGRRCDTCKYLQFSNRNPIEYRFSMKRSWAKRQRIPFFLTLEDFRKMFDAQSGLCFYCDTRLKTDFGSGRSADSISIDRLDCDGPYSPSNTVLACFSCNREKKRKPALIYQAECCAKMISAAMTAHAA